MSESASGSDSGGQDRRPVDPPSPPPLSRPGGTIPFSRPSGSSSSSSVPPPQSLALGAGSVSRGGGAAAAGPSLSLGLPRSSRGRGISRGGGPPGSGPGSAGGPSTSLPIPQTSSASSNASVRSTDNDALVSRLSAIRAGYLAPEPFSELLSSPLSDGSVEASALQNGSGGANVAPHPFTASQPKRPPLINIGTYLRCVAIDRIVEHFLTSEGTGKKQIVSLGAGSDARFWRFKSRPELFEHLSKYVELDFEDITRAKTKRILRSQKLFEALEEVEDESVAEGSDVRDRTKIKSKVYALLPCDLRQLAEGGSGKGTGQSAVEAASSTSSSSASLQEVLSLLSPDLPTLILAECVLAYLPSRSSDSLLASLSKHSHRTSLLAYDICVAGDGAEVRGSARPQPGGLRKVDEADDEEGASRFGRMMLQNLETRGLLVPGARSSPTPSAHARKLRRALEQPLPSLPPTSTTDPAAVAAVAGGSKSLRGIWHDVGASEKARLSRLEGLDEVEELEMLLGHYAISWASRGSAGLDDARVRALLKL